MKTELNTGSENSGMQVCSRSRILSKLQNNLLEKKMMKTISQVDWKWAAET